ncbi:hypothetical protein Spiro2_002074 [Spirobacillus cienkowskii]
MSFSPQNLIFIAYYNFSEDFSILTSTSFAQ